ADAAKAVEAAQQEKKAADDQLAALGKKCEAAEGTLQEIQKRLSEAKQIEAAADRAAIVQGVEKLLAGSSSPTIAALAQLAAELSTLGSVASQSLARQIDAAAGQAASLPADFLRPLLASPSGTRSAAGVQMPADPQASERHFSA